jgi:hypothetical protein
MKPNPRSYRTALVALTLALAGTAQAQGDAARTAPRTRAAGGEVTASGVQQKLTMVDRMVYNSPVATRVVSSGNDEARRHFNDARELHTHARALISTGQLRGADALLNEAIWSISQAQQLVPDQAARLVEERARYEQLRASVDAMLRTYQLGVAGSGVKLAGDSAADRNLTRTLATMEQARAQADDGKVVEANRLLDQALGVLLREQLSRLDGQTLVYDRRYASTRDEFQAELARHRSYESLVPLAVLEFRPSREAQALIDRYVRQSRELRQRAEGEAGANNHAQGVQSLVEATDVLQRALQAAGLAVPQTMGSQ